MTQEEIATAQSFSIDTTNGRCWPGPGKSMHRPERFVRVLVPQHDVPRFTALNPNPAIAI